MADIIAAIALLSAGKHITREETNVPKSTFFINRIDNKAYLFVRSIRPRTGETVESPATFDWDDMSATNWREV